MANTPLNLEPKSIDQQYLPDPIREWVKERIANTPCPENRYDLHNLYFLTGGSGTGKGTLARNIVRSTHCRNRQPGEGSGCGECDICQSDPREVGELANCVWVECGSREGGSDYKKIQRAMEIAKKGPHKVDKPHRDILFVVLDEFHLCSSSDQSALLAISEHIPEDTKFICITAEPEELKPTILNMLAWRGVSLQLPRPDTEDIKRYLNVKEKELGYEEVPEEIEEIIASKANGSYRAAVQLLSLLLDSDSLNNVDRAAYFIQSVPWSQRKILWEALQKDKNRSYIRPKIAELSSRVGEENLCQLLLEDLYSSDEGNIEERDNMTAIRLLSEWSRRPNLSLRYTLIQLKGLKIVDLGEEDSSFHNVKREEMEDSYVPSISST